MKAPSHLATALVLLLTTAGASAALTALGPADDDVVIDGAGVVVSPTGDANSTRATRCTDHPGGSVCSPGAAVSGTGNASAPTWDDGDAACWGASTVEGSRVTLCFGGLAASGTGDTVGGVAASGTGTSRAPVAAVSVSGNATGFIAVSVLGRAEAVPTCLGFTGSHCHTGIPVDGGGAVESIRDGPCGDAPCAAVATTGDAEGGLVAVSATGDSHATGCGHVWRAHACPGLAASGTGNATNGYGLLAASGTGDSRADAGYGCAGASAEGTAVGAFACHGQYAASGTGDATAHRTCVLVTCVGGGAVTGTGNASGNAPASTTGTCGGRACASIEPAGNASGHWVAVGGNDADADVAAVSDGGDARACGSVLLVLCHGAAASRTGNATAPVAASGAGDASGLAAASGTGNADGTVGASGAGDADGGVAASGAGSASCPEWPCAAASGTGRASCTGSDYCVAASGTGDADGGVPVSATGRCNDVHCVAVVPDGDAEGSLVAVAPIGNASCGGNYPFVPACVASVGGGSSRGSVVNVGVGDAAGGAVAASATGNASCDGNCVAVSGMGDATCAFLCAAATGTGDAWNCTDRFLFCPAASGTGDAHGSPGLGLGPLVRVQPDRDARNGSVAASGTGDAHGRSLAASGTGNATAVTAASGTGDARGGLVAVSGMGDATAEGACPPAFHGLPLVDGACVPPLAVSGRDAAALAPS